MKCNLFIPKFGMIYDDLKWGNQETCSDIYPRSFLGFIVAFPWKRDETMCSKLLVAKTWFTTRTPAGQRDTPRGRPSHENPLENPRMEQGNTNQLFLGFHFYELWKKRPHGTINHTSMRVSLRVLIFIPYEHSRRATHEVRRESSLFRQYFSKKNDVERSNPKMYQNHKTPRVRTEMSFC